MSVFQGRRGVASRNRKIFAHIIIVNKRVDVHKHAHGTSGVPGNIFNSHSGDRR